ECLRNNDIGVYGDALGMTIIDYSPFRSSKTLMEYQFALMLASGHFLIPRYIRSSWIGTGDFPLYCRLNIYYPSFLLLTDDSAVVHGYPPA
ncbi:hypothetical protein HAX54_015717, partial [Datura stramonium]|nr:hypothetical protein [Datura stramonium]